MDERQLTAQELTDLRDYWVADYIEHFETHGHTTIGEVYDGSIMIGVLNIAHLLTPAIINELKINAVATAIEQSDPIDVAHTILGLR